MNAALQADKTAPPTLEHFAHYNHQRWRPDQPLVWLRQQFEAGQDTGAWCHVDFYALYMVRAGRGLHVINQHPYAIRRSDVYITPPGAVHRYRDFKQLQVEVFCFQAPLFSDAELDALSALPGFENLFVHGGQFIPSRDYQLHLSAQHYPQIERAVEEVLAEMRLTDSAAPMIVNGLLFRLLVHLARIHAEQKAAGLAEDSAALPTPKAHSPALAEVLHICETRFAEDLSVPQLAALMFLSPGHFSELFVREVGLPPGAYLRQLRLAHAQHLLRDTRLSITEIALRCGFGDSAQLSRAFRAAFAMTPKAYRYGH